MNPFTKIKTTQADEVYNYLNEHSVARCDGPVMVWLDVETTGLDASMEHLLEVGVLLTDRLGNIIRGGWFQSLIVNMDEDLEAIIEGCNEYVTEMHTKSGLINDLRFTRGEQERKDRLDYTTDSVEDELFSFLRQAGVLNLEGPDRQIILAGSSNSLDRDFIQEHMPELGRFIHYRLIDTSGLREIWSLYSSSNAKQPEQTIAGVHRPLADLINSIELYKFLLRELPDAIQGVQA